MMNKSVAALVGALLFSTQASAEKFGAYEEYEPGAIRPKGHLEEFLKRQATGITGHREKLGYPFDGTMWSKAIDNIHFTEGVYNGADEEVSGRGDWWNSGAWWPYEQSAYQLDGMVRVANLVEAPALFAEVERNVKAVVAGASTNGDLFANLSLSPSQWPLAVFFRAADAYASRTGDKSVYEAFRRHYDCKKADRVKWGGRDMLNIEGMLRCAEVTGDGQLRADAITNYVSKKMEGGFLNDRRPFDHGVSHCETLKLPALVYIHTGDRKFLESGRAAVRKTFGYNEQASGQVSANEFLSGKDPRQGFETCIASDMMWSLGYYLQADGDTFAADRMERIAYNALPGAVTKDFRRHQYLSAVNQVICSPFANNTHFNYAEAAWRQYRPSHFPQCCTGNASRAMPAFVQRMWMRDAKTGMPAAMLYGPSEITGEVGGEKFVITETTDYPFGDKVVFTLAGAKAVDLTYRVPGWLDAPDAGSYRKVRLERGKPFELDLAAPLKLERDRNWCWFRRGPLTFSYAVPATAKEDRPGDPFSPVSFLPAGDWNYAVDADALDVAKLKLETTKSAYPFEAPNMRLRIPVRRIKEWQVLDEQRFTPDPPLYTHLTGESAEIELVPYATTTARITCFPDTVRREQLPVVAAYTSGEWHKYNPYKSIALQTFDEEKWTPKDFTGRYKVPQRTPEIYFDLKAYFPCEKPYTPQLAYLLFRVWSDADGEATFCLGAANAYQVFMDGKEVLREEGPVEGVMMAPAWFDHPVKKGYNYVLVKVGCGSWMGQFRNEWGAKLEVFRK